MKKAIVIINPKAGKTRSKTILFDIVEELCKEDYSVKTAVTLYKDHAKELARDAVKKKYDLIVVSGGDGTLSEVTEAVVKENSKIPIGYIPAGSTNDFAISAGIPLNKNAIENITKGEDVSIDIGKFNDKYFNYIASFGAFTSVSYKTPQASKNTFCHFAYLMEGLKDIGSIMPYHVKIEADGRVYEGDYSFGAIGNSTSIGGLIKLKEELVSMSDGLFEVILVKQPQNPIDLTNILHGFTFSDFSNPIFDFFKAKELKITTSGDFDWTLDGEYEKGEKEIMIENINNAYVLRKK